MERTCQWTVEANGGDPRAGRKPFLPRKPLVRAARASQTLRPITSAFASISSEEKAAEQHASRLTVPRHLGSAMETRED